MSLHYIIDGYNIINHPRVTCALKSPSDPRLSLLEFIRAQKLTGSSQNKVTVVFDGYPVSSFCDYNDKGITVIFSRKISADDKIKMLIEESGNRRDILVVSDDNEIRLFVKSLGAHPVAVEEFINAKKKRNLKNEMLKPEITLTQMERINQELKALWLKR